jgi:outer membrane receptor protein involved in Fe transport
VAAAVLILSLPAAAQASEAQGPPSQIQTGESEQVVITALQRVTPILDVPQSASVFTADRLDAGHVDERD